MKAVLLLVFASILKNHLDLEFGDNNDNFPYSIQLDEKYELSWGFGTIPNTDEEVILIKVEVAAVGWAGLGFSPNGGMVGADMVIGWIDDEGKPKLIDLYGEHPYNGIPSFDASQDYFPLSSWKKNGTHMTMKFYRKLNTCDRRNDRILTPGNTERVIWAFDSKMVPKNNQSTSVFKMRRHQHRGTRQLSLRNTPPNKPPPESTSSREVKSLYFRVKDVAVPGDRDTLYWCELFQHKSNKRHVLRIEPVISAGHEKYVHHMILYRCDVDRFDYKPYLNTPGPCFDKTQSVFNPMHRCSTHIVAAWGVGGQSFNYPENVGLPINENNEAELFMLEVHYDNYDLKSGLVDSSGLLLYTTENLMPIEAGLLTLGANTRPQHLVIPPGVDRFTDEHICPLRCTRLLPDEGVTVFAYFLHAHLTGREVRVRHIRDGKELPLIAEDIQYSFDYQDGRVLEIPIKILPGDGLITECVFETLDRSNVTLGGYSSRDEMCLAFLNYYPKADRLGTNCLGSPSYSDTFNYIGISNYKIDSRGNVNIDVNNVTVPFRKYMEERSDIFKGSEAEFELRRKNMKQDTFCWGRNNLTEKWAARSGKDKIIVEKPLQPTIDSCPVSSETEKSDTIIKEVY